MRQFAYSVINPIMVDYFVSLFNCIISSDGSNIKLVGTGVSLLLLGHSGFKWWFSFALVFQWCCSHPRVLQVSQSVSVESSSLTHNRPYS